MNGPLINGKQPTKLTGVPYRIQAQAGVVFGCYSRYIAGITLDLKPARRIVQA